MKVTKSLNRRNIMKFTFTSVLMMFLLSAFCFAQINSEEVFKELKMNNPFTKEAIFTLDNTKEVPDSIGLTFKENCGHVKSYEIVIPKTCSGIKTDCYQLNKTSFSCKNVSYDYSCDEKITDLSGVKDYKITNVIIEPSWCLIGDKYYVYSIDFQPTLDYKGEIITYDKWAWWNATGGTITNMIDINDGLNYTVHTFTSNGTFNSSAIIGSVSEVKVLIIAGGGGSGDGIGGGGGAGGLIYNTSYPIGDDSSISVSVGLGGNGSCGSTLSGYQGGPSKFGVLTATGGGGGTSYDAAGTWQNGGSGGGDSGGLNMHGNGTAGQGYDGGLSVGVGSIPAGAGGGAGGHGGNASGNVAGGGGAGLNYSINGSNVYYASGGSGGWRVGSGGSGINAQPGGGGNGSGESTVSCGFGVNGTGGGAGGPGFGPGYGVGCSGGSGIVIVRYLTPELGDTIPPIITLNAPEDNNLTMDSTPDFFFTATDETLNTFNCSLFINLSQYGTNTSVLNNTVSGITANTTLADGNYTWLINCSDGANNNVSESRHILIYSCLENWTATYGSCLINDTMIKTYTDQTVCNTSYFLPADNGTAVPCNYCSQDLELIVEDCNSTGQQTSYWTDHNFIICCHVTGIAGDCDVLYSPYNLTTIVNCSANITACDEDELTNNFTCYYDYEPILHDKMNIVCIMPDDYDYQCVSNLYQSSVLLATNPEYKEASDTLISFNIKGEGETREYFTPSERMLNAYYTPKNLRTETAFKLQILCTSTNTTIMSEYCISPVYEKPDSIINRMIWARRNITEIIIIVSITCILVGVMIYYVRRFRRGY